MLSHPEASLSISLLIIKFLFYGKELKTKGQDLTNPKGSVYVPLGGKPMINSGIRFPEAHFPFHQNGIKILVKTKPVDFGPLFMGLAVGHHGQLTPR
jgi:hypothetical protein